ncbi:hypothetical protein SAMN02910447_00436 [Ruminococcus sp. YE71]|uniref:hypothetical protein n=1 Tax=unclassified Ruminococcus TaxID=2608920 RepID=UPI0008839996|nr:MULTISPECIES: hypothetical protein [unclassified Ruminococcus]SDA11568.1 hypothetical protein SAMN02910446_00435 [Ruminococcus sp. YE78]SFW15442.1 hypothetical protein SAMN02910447_00436 [Ruminococcus sp. YE71]
MNDLEKMNVFDRVNYINKTIDKVEKEIAEEPMSKKVRTNWELVIRERIMLAMLEVICEIMDGDYKNDDD